MNCILSVHTGKTLFLTEEDWCFAKRFQAWLSSFGGTGHQGKNNFAGGINSDNSLLLSMQSGHSMQYGEHNFMDSSKADKRETCGKPLQNGWMEVQTI